MDAALVNKLDSLIMPAIKDRDLSSPPPSPSEGDRYLVQAEGPGGWAGHAGDLAMYYDEEWVFIPPKEGWIFWVADEDVHIVYDGAAWIGLRTIDFKAGTAADHLHVEADGTIVRNGAATGWDDFTIGLSTARVPAANAPNWETLIGNINEYTFAVNDYLDLKNCEFLHSYKEGSTISFHMHWATNGLDVNARAVKWEVEFTYANMDAASGVGGAFPATTTISAELVIPANTPDLTHMYTVIGTLADATINIGAIMSLRVRRIAAAGTAPTANPFGLDVGVHFEMDTVGSRLTATK